MRTSPTQFETMVQFMELNGDLARPLSTPQGRMRVAELWTELRSMLDADPTGDPRPTVDRWKKVWSDLKLNTKKKAARINRAQNGTGGGPALSITLSALELRVLHIMGGHAATGLPSVSEAGLPLIAEAAPAPIVPQPSPLATEPSLASQPSVPSAPIEVEISDSHWDLEAYSLDHAYGSAAGLSIPAPPQVESAPLPVVSAPPPVELAPPPVELAPLNITNSPGPSSSPALSVGHQRRLNMTPQQRRARGRRSPRRRTNAAAAHSNASTAQLFLRADTDHRDFERERWERDELRERDRSSLRQRELALAEMQAETNRGWLQVARRVLDLAENIYHSVERYFRQN